MLSKSKIKQIRSLELKKFRNELNAFVAEGNKLVADMLHAFECDLLIAKPSWMATQGDIPAKELLEADDDDIRKASFLKNPQDVLAVFKRPTWSLDDTDPKKQLILALDGIQDPGNLGTILRTADALEIPYGWPTGSASNILFVARTPPTYSVPKRYKPLWGLSSM